MLLRKRRYYSKINEGENMKNLKIFCLLSVVLLLASGCSNRTSKLDNAKIYTTVYPVQYIVDYLYGDNSEVDSIYPNGVDILNYSLSEKQVEEYSKGDLFVYLGIGKERDIAKSFVKKNKDLLIINAVDNNLNYDYDLKELWLAPNKFLMLAKNIKDTLNDYLDNAIKEEEVSKKYNELYASVSWIDAEFRSIAKEASEIDNNVIVVATNTFKFLESYGFNVISLEEIENSGSENALNEVKNKFKNSKYTTIIKLTSDEETKLIKELTGSYKANIINVKDLVTNSDSSSDYLSIQYENVATLRNLLIK